MNSSNYIKQKKIVYWIISIGILFLLVTNMIAWIYLQRIKSYFETDLQFRMENIMQMASQLFDADYLALISPGDEINPEIIYYQQLLFDIKENNNLQDIYIISPAKYLLVDINPDFQIMEINRAIDQTLLKKASSGNVASSDIYSLGEHKFLTAAIPLIDESNTVSAIIIAEARAEFFDVFEEFNNGLLIFSFINIIVIITGAFFLYRSLKNLIELQNKIKNQEHLVKLGGMAAAVAHEIRNPLGIIRATNDMIEKKYGKKEDDIFKYIPLELQRLNKLINDFLNFARNKELTIEKINLENLLQKIILGFEDHANLQFEVDINPNHKFIHTDSNSLEQILLNIFQNSIQAVNNEGKIAVKVFQENKSTVAIHIIDNGCGVHSQDMKNIFEPFFTTKESGSGLGLAISKRLAEQFGGSISVESEVDNGTTVKLTIPIKQ